MIIRYLVIVIIPVLFFSSSCGRGEKQQEYVEEKSPVTETKKEEVKKTDSVPPVKTESKDSVKKENSYGEKPAAVISPLEASDYMGKSVTVKGFVADVYKSDKVAYLNFVKKYPDNPFTGVIFAGKFDDFGDITKYENRNVEITGRVSTFRGKPQMILDRKSQIKITE